jgi:hypothetical protein
MEEVDREKLLQHADIAKDTEQLHTEICIEQVDDGWRTVLSA